MTRFAAWHALFALVAAVMLATGADAQQHTSDAAAEPHRILVMLRMAPPHYRSNQAYGGSYGDAASAAARRRTARAIARRHDLALVDGWPMPLLGVDCYVMDVPANRPLGETIAQVAQDPLVAWSEPLEIYHSQSATVRTSDPLFRVQPAASQWHLADLHRIATGRGVTVAVIDSKVDVLHPDLTGQFVANEDFVGNRSPPERHGTGIAGVIAAKAHNGIGISGIAPGAHLMALRACRQNTTGVTLCDSLGLARALQYAIEHGADVLNLSLSGPPSRLLTRLIGIALARHMSVVASYDADLPHGGFPASLPGVIAATDKSLQSWPSRLYGAPGRDVPTTEPGGKWNLVNGSSYSAAHLSGLIALVRQAHGASIDFARAANGWVDACATLLETSRACDCSCAATRQVGSSRRH